MRVIISVDRFKAIAASLLLLFFAEGSSAQWYTDPENPSFYWGSMVSSALCTDRQSGAFFAFHWAGSVEAWLGHIDGNGHFSYQEPPYPGIMRVDTLPFLTMSSYHAVNLVPSEPPGTVIGIGQRWRYFSQWDPLVRAGTVFVKFDTQGPAGFRQIVVDDTFHFVHVTTMADAAGGLAAQTDGHGGVHVVLDSANADWAPFYYNRLDSSGAWQYLWPGYFLMERSDGRLYFILPDGYGGVLIGLKWDEQDPQFPNQVEVRRFDASGEPTWNNGQVMFQPGCDATGYLLEPGRMLIRQDCGADTISHSLFLLDTNGVNLFEPGGRPFALPEPADYPRFIADSIGGFFCTARIQPNLWRAYHYNQQAELVAMGSPDSLIMPQLPDGLGGAYKLGGSLGGAIEDTTLAKVWRWEENLNYAWPSPVVAMDVDSGSGTFWLMASEDHSAKGLVCNGQGVVIFRVDANGSLGPGTWAKPLPLPVADDFRIESAYPNPFNGVMTLTIAVARPTTIAVVAYDILGRMVFQSASFVASPGLHEWHGQFANLSSGRYFIRLIVPSTSSFIASSSLPVLHVK